MKNERVDELIDRVAAELVDGAGDPTFTNRLRERLQMGRTPGATSLLVFVSVTAAVLTAVVVFKSSDAPTIETVSNAGVVGVAPDAPKAPAARTIAADAASGANPVEAVVASRTQSHPVAPRAAAAALVIEPLNEIAPLDDMALDVESLEVDTLAIADLEDVEKEPR